jgi:hypothetical protein
VTADPAGDGLLEVRLIDLPVQVWAAAQEHADELIREFALITGDQDRQGAHAVPARLTELIEELTAQYGGLNTEQEVALARAAAEGVESMDLSFAVPPAAGAAAARLGGMLDDADDYCRSGQHLLTLATPPESLAFRQWYLGEFIRQLDGAVPIAWPAWRAENPSPA